MSNRKNITVWGMKLIAGHESGYTSECGLYIIERVGSTKWGIRCSGEARRQGALGGELVANTLRDCVRQAGKLWPSVWS